MDGLTRTVVGLTVAALMSASTVTAISAVVINQKAPGKLGAFFKEIYKNPTHRRRIPWKRIQSH